MAQPAPVLPLENHQSLRERIVARLRQAIIAGDLPPKTRLMEPELARRLGVSRTPLREAIRHLEAEGLLTTVSRVGTFVTEVSPRDVDDTYVIRAILAELARKTSDYRLYHEAAGRFHEVIFLFSGNQRLQAMYQSLTHQVARFRTLSLAVPQRPTVSYREHRRIAEAILRGRGAEAERLMRAHIEGARAVLRLRITPAEEKPRRGSGPRSSSTSRRRG